MRYDKCELPDQRVMAKYYVLEFPTWVHVVPMTPDGELIMVSQYRHATEEVYLEFPGGTSDPRTGESVQEAAVRELIEETGYEPQSVSFLGKHMPNPALQSNAVHVYLATDCVKTREQELDPYEDIEVVLIHPSELMKQMQHTGGQHSLMLATLAMCMGASQSFT